MHTFRTFIDQYTDMPEADWQRIASCLSQEELEEGELILEEGKVCRHLYFLETGFLRYFIMRDGEEVTKYFTVPPYCFTSQRSFTDLKPAPESIQVLENAVIYKMKHQDAFGLLTMPSWNTFIRKLIQEVQYLTEDILIEMQNKTAEERYVEMLHNGDPILQKAPLKHLASFLGIAPQSLSRIRKKING